MNTNKKIIHIKFPDNYFGDGDEAQDRVHLLQNLIEKLEAHGEPGEFCCFATPFDITCLNDEEALVTIENLLSSAFTQEHLRDGLKTLMEQVIKRIDSKEEK